MTRPRSPTTATRSTTTRATWHRAPRQAKGSTSSVPSGTCSRPTATGSRAMAAEHLTALRIARAVDALAMLVVGGVHLEQYTVAYFSVIPTIGALFLVNLTV